jgi:hypothetical protein
MSEKIKTYKEDTKKVELIISKIVVDIDQYMQIMNTSCRDPNHPLISIFMNDPSSLQISSEYWIDIQSKTKIVKEFIENPNFEKQIENKEKEQNRLVSNKKQTL